MGTCPREGDQGSTWPQHACPDPDTPADSQGDRQSGFRRPHCMIHPDPPASTGQQSRGSLCLHCSVARRQEVRSRPCSQPPPQAEPLPLIQVLLPHLRGCWEWRDRLGYDAEQASPPRLALAESTHGGLRMLASVHETNPPSSSHGVTSQPVPSSSLSGLLGLPRLRVRSAGGSASALVSQSP